VTYIEGTDFTVDYVNGTVTPLNAALAVDVSDGGAFLGPNYTQAGFAIGFDYITQGRDIYGDPVDHNGLIYREIESGIAVPVNITQDELMFDPATGTNMFDTVVRLGQSLLENNRTNIQRAIGEIDTVFKTILDAQSKNGARVNRFETTSDRNEGQTNETTRLRSNIEDAEYAETVSKFSLLQTVYEAALKSAANVLQPSLANFL
jgi:flagellin-like hook-associated protein FlgL